MRHRHLEGEKYSPAAIDDIISRGGLNDWADLRNVAENDGEILELIQKICAHHCAHPEFPEYPPQRYIAWYNWSAKLLDKPLHPAVWSQRHLSPAGG